MKNYSKESISRLQHYSQLYEAARLAMAPVYDDLEVNMNQYLGSDEIDGSGERATTVRNITYELVESQISPDIPVPKVNPACFSEEREANALTVEQLCSSVRDRLPFEAMNDRDERYTYIYGASVWYVEWDNEAKGASVHCISPLNFIPQLGICDIHDMEYCFLKFTVARGELMRRYGISAEESERAACEYEYDNAFASDALSLVICFYRDGEGEIGRLIFSGELILSDTPKYYRRKELRCSNCGKAAEECGCDSPSPTLTDIMLEEIEEEGGVSALPYYTPSDFPIVIRRNIVSEEGIFGSSDCRIIRPQQQAINKVESRILQKLLRSGVTPVMPEDSTVTLSNAIFGQVIKMRAGESADNYSTIDTTPDISGDIKEADRLYDQAKRVLGISDALQGADTVASESGYAKELRIAQSSSRLESKKRLKYLAYSEIYRLIFIHYLAFSDEPRFLSKRSDSGDICKDMFTRHRFIEKDSNENLYYSDDYLFSVDINSDSEYQRESLWEKNLENLESGTLGDRTLPATLLRYWQIQEKAHYPNARDNVEYFKTIVDGEKIVI